MVTSDKSTGKYNVFLEYPELQRSASMRESRGERWNVTYRASLFVIVT